MPFTLGQLAGTKSFDLAPCRGASIESCAKVNLDFDIFLNSDSLDVFGKTLDKRLDAKLDANTKFFEVLKFLLNMPQTCFKLF